MLGERCPLRLRGPGCQCQGADGSFQVPTECGVEHPVHEFHVSTHIGPTSESIDCSRYSAGAGFEPAKSPGVSGWRGPRVLSNHGLRRTGRPQLRRGADLMLYGRDVERSDINALLDGARQARGGVLVLRGNPGAGKSVLLEDAVTAAAGMRVLRATGVESEFELPFAALHQLFRPVLSYM